MKKRDGSRRGGRPKRLTPRQRALIVEDESQQLVSHWAQRTMPFAARLGIGIDELRALAVEALVAAAARYEPARGVPFVAFARPRVRGHLARAMRTAVKQRRLLAALYRMVSWSPRDNSVGAIESFEQIEIAKILALAVAELPIDHVRIIEAYYVEGETIREIARELGKSSGVVHRLHQDAVARLRHQLQLRGLPDDDDQLP